MKKTLKNKLILIFSLIFIVTLIPTKAYGKEESKKINHLILMLDVHCHRQGYGNSII